MHFAGWMASAEMKVLYQRCAFVVVRLSGLNPTGALGPRLSSMDALQSLTPWEVFLIGWEDGETGYLATPWRCGEPPPGNRTPDRGSRQSASTWAEQLRS